MSLLEIKDLQIAFFQGEVTKHVVKELSFSISEGEIVGIVGESGSGKTQTALSILQLLRENAKIVGGSIFFCGNEISKYTEKEIQILRGKEIGIIFQEPMTALNPVHPIGKQIEESMKLHLKITKEERKSLRSDAIGRTSKSRRVVWKISTSIVWRDETTSYDRIGSLYGA